MRQLREVLRLSLSAGLSIRNISASTKLSVGSIQQILKRAEQFQLSWPLPDNLDDQALALKFYPRADARPARRHQEPDWCELHQELKKKGVTQQLLWDDCMDAEATWTQSLPDWLASHVRAFELSGGTAKVLVPDNLKSGVSKSCRYDPELNPSYQQLAAPYQVAVLPARPYKPKDKAKVEVGVQIVERWILAKLRHHTFFSLAELNQCLRALLIELNEKPFKQWPGNRRQWFETLDQPALAALPIQAYQFVAIKKARVNIDYHISYDQHLYSVPHYCVGEQVELFAGDKVLEVYLHGKRIASHVRRFHPGTSTQAAHLPERHAKHQQWTPGRLLHWAQSIGPDVLAWVKTQLQRKPHPEQAYRVCLGLLNLSRAYPKDIDYQNACGLKQAQMASLWQCGWINKAQNLLLTSPCGSGKTYIACALGHQACLKGHSTKYITASPDSHSP